MGFLVKSKINNDIIIYKKCGEYMKQSYSKNYFERYASLSLLKILLVSRDDIVQSDRPDICIHQQWGIEVTQALTPEEAVADVKKPLYTMFHLNPFNHSHDDIAFVFEKIEDALLRKEEKAKHYRRFEKNGLYIFTHCINLKAEDLYHYLVNYSFQTHFYQYLFLNCVSCVYCFDIHEQTMTCFSYSLKELLDMNQEALEFEKHAHKKRRPIDLSKTNKS